jgi:hypothetical protein
MVWDVSRLLRLNKYAGVNGPLRLIFLAVFMIVSVVIVVRRCGRIRK